MIKPKYNWDLAEPTEYITEELAKELKLSPIVKKVLESKNLVQEEMIQDVLQDKIINHDPWALSDMQKAVDRINLAIDKSERIFSIW